MWAALAEHFNLWQAHASGQSVEMENFFSRLTLDIIGKAVFNYDFDSLTHDDPVIEASPSHSSAQIIHEFNGNFPPLLHPTLINMRH